MKVSELIKLLNDVNPDGDMTVGFGYDYGDHWHTHVVGEISDVKNIGVKYSAYHDMDMVCGDDGDAERDIILLK